MLKSNAERCDRSACTCSIHDDFLAVAKGRLDTAVNKVEKARSEAKKEQNIFLGITIPTESPVTDPEPETENIEPEMTEISETDTEDVVEVEEKSDL